MGRNTYSKTFLRRNLPENIHGKYSGPANVDAQINLLQKYDDNCIFQYTAHIVGNIVVVVKSVAFWELVRDDRRMQQNSVAERTSFFQYF